MTSRLIALPPVVAFPETAWRDHLVPEEWEACLEAWITLAEAYLSLPNSDFVRVSAKDESLSNFLVSFVKETALSHDVPPSANVNRLKRLRKQCFLLSLRLLENGQGPDPLLRWEFLADFSRVYGKTYGFKFITIAWKWHSAALVTSMGILKNSLTLELDAGLKGDLKTAEIQLKRLNHLLHASPEVANFFMTGSDFLDSLIGCYKIMNPPLRKTIISTTYLCLIGLMEGEKPKISSLADQLYSLKSAAEAHKAGPTNVNDSLVAELVTVTPVLKQIQERIEASATGSSRAKSAITALESFKKPGHGRPQRLIKRKVQKGKRVASDDSLHDHVHVHQMSLISQVQDLFPDLGSGFVVRLLDEYKDDVEEVISRLLEGSLPSHLDSADRTENLSSAQNVAGDDIIPGLASRSTPPQLPIRRNVFDNDAFDQLAVDTSRLHFGHRNPDRMAEDILGDRSNAPNKAAIMSALAAFDSDDDERDDTYDIEDVGGTVDSATPGNNLEDLNATYQDSNDEALFRAFKATPNVFDRDANTRRGGLRTALRKETGMTDEAIEGWALMLSRNSRQQRYLEAKFSSFRGMQRELTSTAWRASPAGSGTEDSDIDGSSRGRGGFKSRGGRGGRGRGRGDVAGLTGDKDTEVARQRKEANKSSRANHHRRDQRAKKMARGGFAG